MHNVLFMQSLCLIWDCVLKTKKKKRKVEWPHAGRKSVLLIPVSCETFVSLFSPAGPLGSPSVLKLTSDRAAPLLVFKAFRTGRLTDVWRCLVVPGKSFLTNIWLSHQLCDWRETLQLPGLATGQFNIFFHTRGITPQKHLISILCEKPPSTTPITLNSWWGRSGQ